MLTSGRPTSSRFAPIFTVPPAIIEITGSRSALPACKMALVTSAMQTKIEAALSTARSRGAMGFVSG